MLKSILNFKTALMAPLIKRVIKHPKLMESKLFMKAMILFPERISGSYDAKIEKSRVAYHAALLEGLEQVKYYPKKILDLCTGTGLAAFMAADRFPLASIVGLDQSRGMVDIAQGKIPDADKKRIRFESGNAADLSCGDAEFNLIVTSNAPVYLSEAARVLTPGGDILVTFSFGGKAFENARGEIISLLDDNGLFLVNLQSVGKGVFILGQKKQ